ncbi:MAG: glycosyltransferase family 39 protein, partial [Candidatus Eisenbacteria bacterium]|nr:glycosyltransferase family 39 protein [Candidatus Eisenbacteria bacterium]
MKRTAAPGGVATWVLFLVGLVALRWLFVLAALDPSEERVVEVLAEGGLSWPSGPERPLYDREELYAGAAAEVLRQRIPIAPELLRFMTYGSGSLVVSQIAAPLYSLFGPNYLVWKLLPLAVATLGGLFWFLTARRWFGPQVGSAFGLLYLLAPSTFLRTSLIAKGDHAEAMALVGVVFYLATRAAQATNEQTRFRFAAGAGCVFGLGVYLSYSVVPPIAGALVAGLVLSRLQPARAWIGAAIGMLVGLAPWFGTVARLKGSAFQVYGQGLGELDGSAGMAERANAMLRSGLFAGYDLPGGLVVRQAAAFVWLGLVIWGIVRWSGAVRSNGRRSPALILLAAVAAGVLAFVLRAPDASSRYLVAVYPLFLLAVAMLTEAAGPIARGGLLAALVLGAAAQLSVFAGSSWIALRAPLKGYDWDLLGEVVGQKLSSETLRALPERPRIYFWRGLGKRAFHQIDPGQWNAAAALAEAESSLVYEGIGIAMAESERPEVVARSMGPLSPDARAATLRGYLRYGEVAWTPLYLEGQGRALERALSEFPPQDQSQVGASIARTLAILATHDAHAGTREVAPALDVVRGIASSAQCASAAAASLYRTTAG